jgi:D-alanyl-D-alanine dipeptidase
MLPLCTLSRLWTAAVLAAAAPAAPSPDPEAAMRAAGLVDAAGVVPELVVELKYSTPDNFMKRDVYGALERCFLQPEVADMLKAAAARLRAQRPDLRLLAYDCARPQRVQRIMWDLLRGRPEQRYVADPNKSGSVHSLGCAVDVSLADAEGQALDMGSAYDHMGRESQPRHEVVLRLEGKLSADALANRLLLRHAMVAAGFYAFNHEWWHFECLPAREAFRRYRPVP